MSWVREAQYSWAQQFVLYFLKKGPLPKHVGIIMDGNRRFARKKNMEKFNGHLQGFDKLAETLQWCRDLGITEVTVYAFSIENFKRSSEEVDYLMKLVKEKFVKLLEEKDKLAEHGVRVRIIGNLDLLPEDVRRLAAEVIITTRYNNKACLNVCMAYTSRDEMTVAIQKVRAGVQSGLLQENDITEELLERCMYMRESPPVDLLIRTSGETRLSDFLMWQTSFACIFFVNVLWPEFGLWHLFAAVFHYQCNYFGISKARDIYVATRRQLEGSQGEEEEHPEGGNGHCPGFNGDASSSSLEVASRERTRRFLEDLNRRYWSELTGLQTRIPLSSILTLS